MIRNRTSALGTWGPRLTGTAALLIGTHWLGAWLGGWAAAWAAAGSITVKTNMALALVMSGTTLLLASLRPREAGRKLATLFGSFVLLIGLLTVAEHLFHIDLGIDQLLATEPPGAPATVSPNRMGPLGAVTLILLGAGFLSLFWDRRPISQYLGLAVCIFILVPAVGFLYSAEEFYNEAHLTAMAWPTVIALVLLGTGLILADADKGPLARLLRRDAGGAVLRRMLPAIIVLPLGLGFLAAYGQRHDAFDTSLGIGLLVIASILVFALFLWRTAFALSREEEVAREAQTTLHASQVWFHRLFGTITEGFCTIEVIFDEKGKAVDYRFLETNRAFEKQTGLRNAEGKLVKDLLPNHEAHWFEIYGKVALTGASVQFENEARALNQWYQVTAFRFGQPEEHKVAVLFNDITERKQAEEALRTSEQRLRVALKAGGAGAWDWNMTTGAAEISDSYRELFGMERDVPFTYDSWLEAVHRDDRERCRAYGEAYFASKDATDWDLEFRVNTPHLGVRWHHATGKVERDEAGNPQRFLGVTTDVTDRKRIEESEERLKALISHNPSLVFLKDESGRYVYLNDTYEMQYAHTKGWFGKTDFDIWPKESAELFRANDAEVLKSGQMRQVLEDSTDLNGKRHCWLTYKFPFTDSKGNRYLGGIALDATDRVLAEEAVREKERQLTLAMEAGKLVPYDVDLTTGRMKNSPQLSAAFGLEHESAFRTRDQWLRLIHDDDRPGVLRSVEEAVKTGREHHFEYRINYPDGTVHWLETHGRVLLDEQGCSAHLIGFLRDITARKQVAEALHESEEKFRSAFSNAAIAFAMTTPEGRFVDANPAYLLLTGLSMDELKRMTFQELIYADDRADNLRLIDEMLGGQRPDFVVENRFCRKEWPYVWVRESVSVVRNADGKPKWIVALLEDITERKEAEDLLLRNNETFHSLIENNPMGIYVVDADCKLRNVSLGARRAFANVPAPLIGRGFNECMRTMWAEPFATEVIQRFRHTLETGEPYVSNSTIEQRRDTGDVEAYDWRIERITLPDGRFGVVCYYYDLTERQRLEQKLRESEERHAFLVRLGDALRPLADPASIQEAAERVLGEHLGASRVAYFEVLEGDYVVNCDYVESVPHMAGKYPIASFGSRLLGLYSSGRTAVQNNISADDTLTESERAAFAAIQIHAFVGVPLVKNGEFLAGLAVHMASSREWTAAEVSLIEATAERTWAAVERARAERNLRERDERLRLAIQHSHLMAWQCDSLKRFNWVYNPRFGPAEGELLGMTLEDLNNDGAMNDFVAQAREVLEKGAGSRRTIRYVHSDGRERYFDQQVEPVLGAGGEPLGIMGTSLEVTERVLAEQRLQKSEQGFRLMIEHSLEPMLLVNETGVIECISQRGAEVLGFQEAELVGTSMERFLDWSTKLDLSLRVQDFFKHAPLPARGVVRIKRKKGDWCWTDVHASFVNYGQSPGKYMLKFEPIDMCATG